MDAYHVALVHGIHGGTTFEVDSRPQGVLVSGKVRFADQPPRPPQFHVKCWPYWEVKRWD